MAEDEHFDIKKWHEIVSSNPLVREKVYLPALEWGGLNKPSKETKIVVDLGCGSGELLKLACQQNPNILGVGIDYSDDVIRFAKTNLEAAGVNVLNATIRDPTKISSKVKKPVVLLLRGTQNRLPIAPSTADIVYTTFDVRDLAEIAKLLCKPLTQVDLEDVPYDVVLRLSQVLFPIINAMYVLRPGGVYIYSGLILLPKDKLDALLEDMDQCAFKIARKESVGGEDVGRLMQKAHPTRAVARGIEKKEACIYRWKFVKTREHAQIIEQVNRDGTPLTVLRLVASMLEKRGREFYQPA